MPSIKKHLLVIAIILLFTMCKKDVVRIDYDRAGSLQLIFDRGDIIDLAVAYSVVCFTKEGTQLVAFDRFDSTFTFKSEFNSGVRGITNIEKLNHNQVLVGIEGFGIYAYTTPDDYVRYGDIGDLRFFNNARQFCVAQGPRLLYKNQWGSYYLLPVALPPNTTQTLTSMVTQHNIMWIGTADTGVVAYTSSGQESRFHADQNYIADDSIKALAFDKSDNLWVLSRTGLAVKRASEWLIYSNPDEVRNNAMTFVGDQILIATDKGVYRLKNDSIQPYEDLNQLLPILSVNVVEPDEQGRLWIGTGLGMYVYTP